MLAPAPTPLPASLLLRLACPASPQNAHRFAVFVCSKGKREYIQLLWLMLDPAGELIPESGARSRVDWMTSVHGGSFGGWMEAAGAGLWTAARCGAAAAIPSPSLAGSPPPAPPPRPSLPARRADWGARLTSTFPDTLAQAANKSALTALGCYDVTKPHVPTQVALPMLCLDDSMGGWFLGQGRGCGAPGSWGQRGALVVCRQRRCGAGGQGAGRGAHA